MKTTLPGSLLGVLALLLVSGEHAMTQDYAAEIEAWRVDRVRIPMKKIADSEVKKIIGTK